MSILTLFELPSFEVASITVRVFDKWPDPYSEINDTMQYESIQVKPIDVTKYVQELVRRIREHDYRTFNFSDCTRSNAAAKADKAGFKRQNKVAVVRYTEPESGKVDRTVHIGLSFSYEVKVDLPKGRKTK